MSDKIYIEKTIYARDKHGVKRQVFIRGQFVEPHVYEAVLRTNTIVNPQDLPKAETKDVPIQVISKPVEVKILDVPVVEREVIPEAVAEVEQEVIETSQEDEVADDTKETAKKKARKTKEASDEKK